MVDYSYYRDVYLGSRVGEKEFKSLVARASDALERFKRIYRVAPAGEDSEAMALCAMAEALSAARRRQDGVSYASVGGVTVRYDDSRSRDRSLLEAARVYLDIRRAFAG